MITSYNSNVVIVIQLISFLHEMRTKDVRVPAKCMHLTPQNLVKCCPLKPMFDEDSLKACGISPANRPSPLDSNCSSSICLFKNLGVLGRNNTIVNPKLIIAIDNYALNKKHIKPGTHLGKLHCIGKRGGPPLPRSPFGPEKFRTCQLHKIFICYTTFVLWNCKFIRGDHCRRLSAEMDICQDFVFPTEPLH